MTFLASRRFILSFQRIFLIFLIIRDCIFWVFSSLSLKKSAFSLFRLIAQAEVNTILLFRVFERLVHFPFNRAIFSYTSFQFPFGFICKRFLILFTFLSSFLRSSSAGSSSGFIPLAQGDFVHLYYFLYAHL